MADGLNLFTQDHPFVWSEGLRKVRIGRVARLEQSIGDHAGGGLSGFTRSKHFISKSSLKNRVVILPTENQTALAIPRRPWLNSSPEKPKGTEIPTG
jgi:hypothetical protein